MSDPVVVVGAGLSALRTAESLRKHGYAGEIRVFGEEPHRPYNRPPLSKAALAGDVDAASLEFPRRAAVEDVQWHLGEAVVSSDLAAGTVTTDSGHTQRAAGLVVASGIRPRRLPIPGPEVGRVVLRTVDDSIALRDRLQPGTRLLILGAGFIGCEVAATATALGCAVDVVAMDSEPMIRPLGTDLGAAMRVHHERHGVRFHLERTVEFFEGGDQITGAVLDDGTRIPADIVLEAVGSMPNVEWLEGNGLDLSNGVVTDAFLAVVDSPLPAVAVGDVARHPNALFPGPAMRVEHWNMPTEMGKRAGRTLASLVTGSQPDGEPFDALPSFWSDQYDLALQSFGIPGSATDYRLADGTYEGDCVVEYYDDSGLIGVVGVNRTPDLVPYRKQLLARQP